MDFLGLKEHFKSLPSHIIYLATYSYSIEWFYLF